MLELKIFVKKKVIELTLSKEDDFLLFNLQKSGTKSF